MNDTKNTSPLRPLLWTVLILSAAANATTSSLGLTVASIPLGVVALAAAIALVVHHYRHRTH